MNRKPWLTDTLINRAMAIVRRVNVDPAIPCGPAFFCRELGLSKGQAKALAQELVDRNLVARYEGVGVVAFDIFE